MSVAVLRKSVSGTAITLGVTGLRFAVGFGSQFVLARLLLPEDFGAMAFAWMVIGFLGTFTNFQSQKYIIRTKSDIERIVNTSFTFELLLTGLIFLFALIATPQIMIWLGKPDLTLLVQVLALSLLYYPFLQLRSLLERQLDFGLANIPDIIGIVLGTITSVALAYLGYGVWSLVFGRLVQFLIQIIPIWIVIPYHPRWELDIKVIKEVTKFGWPLLGVSVLIFFYWNIDYYLVGNLLDEEQLGYYWLAFQLSQYMLQLKKSIVPVLFPSFTHLTRSEMGKAFVTLTRLSIMLYALPSVVIFSLGSSTISHLFGVRWLPALQAFQLLILLSWIRGSLSAYLEPLFLKEGRTRLLFLLTIVTAGLLLSFGYILTLLWGILGTAFAVLIANLLPLFWALHEVKKSIVINYLSMISIPSLTMIGIAVSSQLLGIDKIATNLGVYVVFATLLLSIYSGIVLIFDISMRREITNTLFLVRRLFFR